MEVPLSRSMVHGKSHLSMDDLGVSPWETSKSPGLPGAGLLGPVHGLPEAASGGSAAGNRQRRRWRVRELSHLQDPTGLPLTVEAPRKVCEIFREM